MTLEPREVALEPPPARRSGEPDVVAFVRTLRADGDADVVRWCVAPLLSPALDVAGSRSGTVPRVREAIRTLSALAPLRRGLDARRQGRALHLSHGGNPRRTLAAIEQATDRPVRPVTPRSVSARSLRRWTRAGRHFETELGEAARELDLEIDGALLGSLVSAAVRSLARAERVLLPHPPSVVVVATQHAIDVRSALAIAQDHGIPSVYFPHAPVESTPKYADLPTQAAGLRGQGELDLYTALGARGAMQISGNPAVVVDLGHPPTLAAPPLFALPALDRPRLEQLLQVAAAAIPGPLDLAPHPRADVEWIEAELPVTWRVRRGQPTFELLLQGPSFVLQHTSGVAWESLVLGLPTIDLNAGPAGYPLIEAPYVLRASSASELRGAVAAAAEQGRHPAERDRLITWARHWCERTGAAAATACVALLDDTADQGPGRPRLLDAWGAPSTEGPSCA